MTRSETDAISYNDGTSEINNRMQIVTTNDSLKDISTIQMLSLGDLTQVSKDYTSSETHIKREMVDERRC